MMRRKSLWIAISLIMVLGILISAFGCATTTPTPPKEVKVLKYGISTPLSGPVAYYGIPPYNGFQIEVDRINNAGGFSVGDQTYKWELVAYDNKFDATEGMTQVTRLVQQDKVQGLSIFGSPLMAACQPIYEPAGVIDLGFGGVDNTALGPEFPMTFMVDAMMEWPGAAVCIKFIKEDLGAETVAVINPNVEFGVVRNDIDESTAERLGLEITNLELYEWGTTDFYPVCNRVMQKNPDVITTGGSPAQDTSLMIKVLRELGYEGEIVTECALDEPTLIEIAGEEAAEGIYAYGGSYELTPEQEAYKQEYIARFGEADWNAAALYMCGLPLSWYTQAIEEAQSLDNYVIADHIRGMTLGGWLGTTVVIGKDYCGLDCIMMYPGQIAQMQNGKFIKLKEITITTLG